MKKYISLFVTMLKIGLFTFGGGYAMIAILQNEFVTKKKWIDDSEFMDMVVIAESTPGPIAINSSTYIGYKIGGVLGSILATVAICIPSFCIIFAISLFFDAFMNLPLCNAAFKGIRVCVVLLIFSAGLKLLGSLEKTLFNVIWLIIAFSLVVIFTLFSVNFSSIFLILIGAAAGLAVYFARKVISKKSSKGDEK